MKTPGLVGASVALVMTASFARAQDGQWDHYVDPRFGYSFAYPSDMFPASETASDGRIFLSADGRSKLKVFATYNSENFSLDDYRAGILRRFPGYERIHYGPRGATWFVLSGYRGAHIYYQKVMFSCGGRVINAFALDYPIEQRELFDPIVTAIEKNFQSASGRACSYASR